MRARLALWASAQHCALREVVLAHKPTELLQASAKATVPVLVLPDGSVIDQSLDIMLWALRRADPQHWLPATPALLEQALALIATCDGPFKAHLDRYKYPHRYALPDGLTHRAQGADFLQRLNQQLATAPYLHGTHWGLADAAVAPFVRQFAHTDAHWFAAQPWPALQTWLRGFEEAPRFAQIMDKYPAWQTDQAVTVFPPLKP